MEKISIIVPCKNEHNYIQNFLENILSQDYPKNLIECFIIDGNSDDGSIEIINKYVKSHHHIYKCDNSAGTAPHAMNIGIKKSSGSYIIRMDVHAKYPTNYISRLVEGMKLYKADNIGGVINTIPPDNSLKSFAISKTTSHIFGVGNSYFRIGAKEVKKVDTVPFGCFRKELFNEFGNFDEELIRNQDDEFNNRLVNGGKKIILIPDLIIDYYARDNYRKVSGMFYQYGLFKPIVAKKSGKPSSIRQLIPPLFVFYTLLSVLSVLYVPIAIFVMIPLILYILINICISFSLMLKSGERKIKLFWHYIFGFIIIHYSYGFGSLKGYLNLLAKKSIKSVLINR